MRDYYILGNVNVPEEKKEELNRYVLELLYRTGIRKTAKIYLDGEEHTVVNRPVPDTDGIVRFDYSIFEKKVRDVAEYNMNTCRLDAPEAGYREFGVAMNMVMVLLEEYSGGSCYYMHNGKPDPLALAYLDVLYSITGRKFHLAHRGKSWDMLLFFHQNNIDLKLGDIFATLPFDIAPVDTRQMYTVVALKCMDEINNKDKSEEMDRAKIPDVTQEERVVFLSQIMRQMYKNNPEETFSFIKRLTGLSRDERTEISRKDDCFGTVAELSLYLSPPLLIGVYCVLSGKEFWSIWDSLGITGYADPINNEEKEERKEREKREWGFPFYKVILRDNEDDFLEFWDGQRKMELSNELKENMEKWNRLFKGMTYGPDFRMKNSLATIFGRIDENWDCRYPDMEMIKEFIKNQDNDSYKKAAVLFIDLLDAPCRMFPELTPELAREVSSRGYKAGHINRELDAYMSMLVNHELRAEVLGF